MAATILRKIQFHASHLGVGGRTMSSFGGFDFSRLKKFWGKEEPTFDEAEVKDGVLVSDQGDTSEDVDHTSSSDEDSRTYVRKVKQSHEGWEDDMEQAWEDRRRE